MGRCADDVLALVVLDEVEVLERGDDILCLDRGALAKLFDADAALPVAQELRNGGAV
jgi:hypothetical protein